MTERLTDEMLAAYLAVAEDQTDYAVQFRRPDLVLILTELQERRAAEQQAGRGAEEAWAAVAEEMGEKAHEAWKRYMIGQGYADHPNAAWDGVEPRDFYHCVQCGAPCSKHHPDMVPWEDLPENKRGKYLKPAHDVFVTTYALAAQESARVVEAARRLNPVYYDEFGSHCIFDVTDDPGPLPCGYGDPPVHGPNCPWRALTAALAGKPSPEVAQ